MFGVGIIRFFLGFGFCNRFCNRFVIDFAVCGL